MDSIDKELDFKRKLNALKQSPVKAGGYVSPLEGENMLAKGGKIVPEVKQTIKGVTQQLGDSDTLKTISGNAFQDKIKSILNARNASRLAKTADTVGDFAKRGLKSIPILGSLAAGGLALASTGDASAAQQEMVPVLNEAEALGPEVDSIEYKLESGQPLTDQERMLLERRR